LLSGADLTDYELERLRTAGVNVGNAHEVESSHDMEAMVTAGFGIAVAPTHALRSATVHHLNLSGLDVQRTVAVYTVAGRARSREAAALLNLLRGKHWG
jgi:DNA-binding transcriptional LysR family regulator